MRIRATEAQTRSGSSRAIVYCRCFQNTVKGIPGLVPSHFTFLVLHSSQATATFCRFAGLPSPLKLSLRAAESEKEEGEREASIRKMTRIHSTTLRWLLVVDRSRAPKLWRRLHISKAVMVPSEAGTGPAPECPAPRSGRANQSRHPWLVSLVGSRKPEQPFRISIEMRSTIIRDLTVGPRGDMVKLH